MRKTKIALITGYLGAGKTSLINHILANDEGIKVAVIVNDIGEINVDAELIAQGGLKEADSLVALTNGCICCSLSQNLAEQLNSLAREDFDYILIEASGVCEPIPIAYTISQYADRPGSALELDNIIAVVDAARMLDEFDAAKSLVRDDVDEEDIEALLIQQIEFCTTLIINKCDLVDAEALAEIKAIVASLQKDAKIIEATEAEVSVAEILNTGRFDFERAYHSAAWLEAVQHPEHHHEPEVLEYGLSTFVYEVRWPLDFDAFSDAVASWDRSVIRVKGCVWAFENFDTCYLFESAGAQMRMTEDSRFLASAPDEVREEIFKEQPELLDDWDPEMGDRMTRLCFIGKHMDHEAIRAQLDACLHKDKAEVLEYLD